MVFKKTCATCHRLENEGIEVGPDLLSALRNKSPEQLLIDILDPSREVDPRYLNYLVTTKNGQVFTGMIAAETVASVTLRRGEKAEDTILRGQIDAHRGDGEVGDAGGAGDAVEQAGRGGRDRATCNRWRPRGNERGADESPAAPRASGPVPCVASGRKPEAHARE